MSKQKKYKIFFLILTVFIFMEIEMSSFSSPFAYFVFLEWSFFILALITYITVWKLTGWKDFFNQM